MTAKAELAARFDRVLSALRAVIAAETALDPAWEETKKGVGGAFADALFPHTRARRAFEDETPTMDALVINLKDNRYKDPSWPSDGTDDAQTLRSVWHTFHNAIGAGKPFAPDDLNAMRNLYAALERAREKSTEPQPPAAKSSEAVGGMGWQEAQDKAEKLRLAGERWTSYRKMAKAIGCYESVLHDAINKHGTVGLQEWAKKQRGTSRLEVPLDGQPLRATAQGREPDPGDMMEDDDVDVMLARLLDQAKPDERASINAMTPAERRQLAETAYRDRDVEEQTLRYLRAQKLKRPD